MKSLSTTFTTECKEEIATSEFPLEEPISFLSGFAWNGGSLKVRNGEEVLDLSSSNAKVAKCLYQLLSTNVGSNARFSYTKSVGFAKQTRFHCLVDFTNELEEQLELDVFMESFPEDNISTEEKAASFISGAFLASGSVNDPSSSNYHFEISTTNESFAKFLVSIFNKNLGRKINAKIVKRKNHFVVYVKKSEFISEILVLIGATNCCLKFEDIRINRDFSNIYNRYANLDTANMSKTIKAGERQVEEIKYLNEKIGLNRFAKGNFKLLSLMNLRLSHPEYSLEELAKLLSEELTATVSKSNVNHLFRYIHEEYERLKNEER